MTVYEDPDHPEGWNGTFDNKVRLSNMENKDGAIYVGQLYLSDGMQPIRMIFDTGSDYMAVTSNLCQDPKYDHDAGQVKGQEEALFDKSQHSLG